tara:strand:+ start:436 stop:729 length:294 start_codon:yes stop_codon:yes gene_type:complete
MADRYFSESEKQPKDVARKALKEYAEGLSCLRYQRAVRFESDDGGGHLVLYIEVENPAIQMDAEVKDALGGVKWMGWRYMVAKVPVGYIEAIVNKRD